MNDDDLIEIEGGEILANLDERTITGLVLPYGEEGRTNVGRFEVQAGVIQIPADPSVVSLNVDHDRYSPVGRATRLWEEPRGIMATFAIARTPEGDAALADATSPQGKRRCLSGEFRTGIKAGKATGGNLAAAALVERGAFPSAMVLAADTEDGDTTTSTETYITEYTDEDGVTWTRKSETTTTTTTSQTTTEPEADEADDDTEEGESEVTATATPSHTPAGAPAGQTQPRAVGVLAGLNDGASQVERASTLSAIVGAIATLRSDRHNQQARDVLAALNDITTTSLADGITPPNWVGLISQGIAYVREYVSLGTVGSDISINGKKGYKIKRGTQAAPVEHYDGTWAGNKAALGSFTGFTETASSTRQNFALGADFAREFYDLPGGAEAVAGLLSLIVEDYYVWSDMLALEAWVDTAGTPVAPTPAKWANYNYPDALGVLIQGILLNKRRKADGRRDTPSFAILNEAGYEELLYAAGGAENLPAFVSIAVNTASQGTVDGNVKIVQGDIGIEDSAAAIVGSSYAIDFDELPGSPLTLDALHIANGGIDRAIHGYFQTFVKRPEAVVLVGTADAA